MGVLYFRYGYRSEEKANIAKPVVVGIDVAVRCEFESAKEL